MNPMWRRRKTVKSSSLNLARLNLSIFTLPDVGRSRPPSMLRRVDLPLPEVPMMAVNSPRSTEIFTSSSAFTMFGSVPYCFVRFFVLKILMSNSSFLVCLALQYRGNAEICHIKCVN